MSEQLKFGLIGHPVGHSFSALYLNDKFRNENINAVYRLIDIKDISEFPALLQNSKWNGFNVTIPYKTQIIRYLDRLSDTALKIGAVNTIEIIHTTATGKPILIGHNTDAIGFMETLTPWLKPYHNNALILGTGGASLAVQYSLAQLGIEYKIVSRSKRGENMLCYSDVTPEILDTHRLIINTTPLGMYPNVGFCPDIPYYSLSDKHLLYDLVYNPEKTIFLKKGEEMNATTVSGISMLHAQADAATKIWIANHH